MNENCCVLVPVLSSIEPECERGLTELSRRGYKLRVMRGATCIDQVRSLMATEALEAGFEDLMWIDADVAFSPDDVDKLRLHDLDFVCGLYTKKGAPGLACRMKPGTGEVTMGEGGGLIEIQYAAMGFTLTRAAIYQRLNSFESMPPCLGNHERRMRPYFLPMVFDGEYLAEDYAFSWRASGWGFTPMADTTIRLYHIGRYAYSYEDLAGRQRVPTVQLAVQPAVK